MVFPLLQVFDNSADHLPKSLETFTRIIGDRQTTSFVLSAICFFLELEFKGHKFENEIYPENTRDVAGKMTQQVKALTAEPDHLSSIPRTHMVGREN